MKQVEEMLAKKEKDLSAGDSSAAEPTVLKMLAVTPTPDGTMSGGLPVS